MAHRNTTPRPSRDVSRARHRVHRSAGLLLLTLAACLPSRAAFLRVPVAIEPPPTDELLTVAANCEEIRAHIPNFDPSKAAFYARGRQALPFELADRDADGVPDQVLVTFPCLAFQSPWLVIVYPGAADQTPAPATHSGRRVRLDFRNARR